MVKSNQGLYFIETWNKIKGLHFERDIFRIAFYVHQGEITPQNEEAKVHKNLASNDFTIQVTSSCYYIYVSHTKVFKDTIIILVFYSQNARFSFEYMTQKSKIYWQSYQTRINLYYINI